MKSQILHFLVSSMVLPLTAVALSQTGGALTPPGPPARSMKSLAEVEPRTPLVDGAPGVSIGASGTITLSQSGSYFLAESLTVTSGNGITVTADGVTLDLRGFTITSTSAAADGSAIAIDGSNIAIYNGQIISGVTWDGSAFGDGPGFESGIFASSPGSENLRIRDVSVEGVSVRGIFLADLQNSLVESCTVNLSGGYAIYAGVVVDCVVKKCGGAIFGEIAENCRGHVFAGDAIAADVVIGCYGITESDGAASSGISAAIVVENCYGRSFGGIGIRCNGTVSNSFGFSNSLSASGDGISAGTAVSDSFGRSSHGDGIDCVGNVSNSSGASSVGNGIKCGGNVLNSYGYTFETAIGTDGIFASGNVANSYGLVCSANGDDGIDACGTVSNSQGESAGGHGIEADRSVTNSYGRTTGTGDGISTAGNVMNSYGWANAAKADDGIDATHVISFSFGISESTGGGVGLECVRAVGCTSSGGENVFTKYLMP